MWVSPPAQWMVEEFGSLSSSLPDLKMISSPLPCLMKGILPFGIAIRMWGDWWGNCSSWIGQEETLCPHQDYVSTCLPTKEEQEQLDAFSQQRMLCSNWLSDSLANTSKLPSLIGSDHDDELLNEPKHLCHPWSFFEARESPFQTFQDL